MGHLASMSHQRFKYFVACSWSFVKSLSIDGAKDFLEKVQERPLDEHDPQTMKLYAKSKDDLEARAVSSDVTSRHAETVRVMKLAALDESAGESYQRSTTHEKPEPAQVPTITSSRR